MRVTYYRLTGNGVNYCFYKRLKSLLSFKSRFESGRGYPDFGLSEAHPPFLCPVSPDITAYHRLTPDIIQEALTADLL